MALLAGFRGVVADFLWIQNAGYFRKTNGCRCTEHELVTTLQPQSAKFWEQGAWHMAWNIAYSVTKDPKNDNAQGIRREREWHQKARDFLLRGIENIPKPDLYFALAWLYLDKYKEPCQALDAYTRRHARVRRSISRPAWIVGRSKRGRCKNAATSRELTSIGRKMWNIDHPGRTSVERDRAQHQTIGRHFNIPEEERVSPRAIPAHCNFMKYAILSDIHANLRRCKR